MTNSSYSKSFPLSILFIMIHLQLLTLQSVNLHTALIYTIHLNNNSLFNEPIPLSIIYIIPFIRQIFMQESFPLFITYIISHLNHKKACLFHCQLYTTFLLISELYRKFYLEWTIFSATLLHCFHTRTMLSNNIITTNSCLYSICCLIHYLSLLSMIFSLFLSKMCLVPHYSALISHSASFSYPHPQSGVVLSMKRAKMSHEGYHNFLSLMALFSST